MSFGSRLALGYNPNRVREISKCSERPARALRESPMKLLKKTADRNRNGGYSEISGGTRRAHRQHGFGRSEQFLQPRIPFPSAPRKESWRPLANSTIGRTFWRAPSRVNRTYTIGVILEEIGDAYGSLVISGIERYLRAAKFFFSYRCSPSRQEAARNLLDDAPGPRGRRLHHSGYFLDRRALSSYRGGCRPSQDQGSN